MKSDIYTSRIDSSVENVLAHLSLLHQYKNIDANVCQILYKSIIGYYICTH